jgi:hypothetical protein
MIGSRVSRRSYVCIFSSICIACMHTETQKDKMHYMHSLCYLFFYTMQKGDGELQEVCRSLLDKDSCIHKHARTHTHTTYEQTNVPSLTHANTYTHTQNSSMVQAPTTDTLKRNSKNEDEPVYAAYG